MFNRSDMITKKHISKNHKKTQAIERKTSPKKKDISTIIINVVLIFSLSLLAFAGYTAIRNRNSPEDAYILGLKPIYIQTGSMEPTLRTGSLAIVKKTDFDDCKVNDIIVFKKDDKLITHRVTQVTDEYVKTKGDNNQIYDNFSVYPEEVQAKVILKLNWVATFLDDIKTVKGIIKWFVFPIFVIVIIIVTIKIIKKVLKDDGTFKDVKEVKKIYVGSQGSDIDTESEKTEDTGEISEDDFFGLEDDGDLDIKSDNKAEISIYTSETPTNKITTKKYHNNMEQVELKTQSEIDDWRLK